MGTQARQLNPSACLRCRRPILFNINLLKMLLSNLLLLPGLGPRRLQRPALHLALVCHQRQALPGQLLGSLSLLARKIHLEMTIPVMIMVVVMVLGTMIAMSRAGTFHKIVFLCRRAQSTLLVAALVADLGMVMAVVVLITPKRRRMTNLMRFLQFLLRILRLGRGRENHMTFLLALRFGTLTMTGRLSLVGRQRS